MAKRIPNRFRFNHGRDVDADGWTANHVWWESPTTNEDTAMPMLRQHEGQWQYTLESSHLGNWHTIEGVTTLEDAKAFVAVIARME